MEGKANTKSGAGAQPRLPRVARAILRGAGLLAAGLLAPALTAPPATAATPAYGTGRPLAVIARSVGNVDVYWRGSDGYLYQKVESGGVWRSPVRTPIGGLASDPAATIGSHGYDYVFWEGTDGGLWEAAAGPQGWIGPTKINDMGVLGSQPTAASIPNASGVAEIDVFWKGTGAGNLWRAEYLTSTGTWTGPFGLGMGQLGSAPTATEQQTSAGTQIQVFWRGTDNALWEGDTSGGSSWSGPTSHGMGPLGSAPSAASLSYGKEIAFWAGTTTTLWQANWDSTTWNGVNMNGPNSVGFGPMGSAPTVAAQQPDGWDVFWIGTDSNLWEATSMGPAWTSDESLGPLTVPATPGSAPTTPAPSPTTPGTSTSPNTSTSTRTSTTVTVPPPKPALKQVSVAIKLDWKWDGDRTRLIWIRFGRLPAHATIRVSCDGRHCLRPAKAAGTGERRKLIASLEHNVFRAGQKLLITIGAPGRKPERAECQIRNGKEPLAKLLK